MKLGGIEIVTGNHHVCFLENATANVIRSQLWFRSVYPDSMRPIGFSRVTSEAALRNLPELFRWDCAKYGRDYLGSLLDPDF